MFRIFQKKVVCEKSPSTPRKAAVNDLDDMVDGDLDYGD